MKRVKPKFAPGEILDARGLLALANKLSPGRSYSLRAIDAWLRRGVRLHATGEHIRLAMHQDNLTGYRTVKYDDAVVFLRRIFNLEPVSDEAVPS
jgi:hypothetical protein